MVDAVEPALRNGARIGGGDQDGPDGERAAAQGVGGGNLQRIDSGDGERDGRDQTLRGCDLGGNRASGLCPGDGDGAASGGFGVGDGGGVSAGKRELQLLIAVDGDAWGEFGRASCRERVEISAVVVLL